MIRQMEMLVGNENLLASDFFVADCKITSITRQVGIKEVLILAVAFMLQDR